MLRRVLNDVKEVKKWSHDILSLLDNDENTEEENKEWAGRDWQKKKSKFSYSCWEQKERKFANDSVKIFLRTSDCRAPQVTKQKAGSAGSLSFTSLLSLVRWEAGLVLYISSHLRVVWFYCLKFPQLTLNPTILPRIPICFYFLFGLQQEKVKTSSLFLRLR